VTWWLFISGVFAIVAAMMERNVGLTWGWTLAFGVPCIVAGVFAIMSPPATVATIMGFIAAFALLGGILHLYTSSACSRFRRRSRKWATRCTARRCKTGRGTKVALSDGCNAASLRGLHPASLKPKHTRCRLVQEGVMPQNLIVVGFGGTRRASEVLSELQKLNDNWVIDLNDAVAAYRTDDGQLRIDSSVAPTRGQGADMGVLVGGMLGALVAAPFTGGLSAAAAGAAIGGSAAATGLAGAAAGAEDATDWKRTYGITDEFVTNVGKMIQPGQSAVFALIRTAAPDIVAEKFRGYGGKILTTTLSPGQAARVERTLRG
jgi:uncharacterized membrane protein